MHHVLTFNFNHVNVSIGVLELENIAVVASISWVLKKFVQINVLHECRNFIKEDSTLESKNVFCRKIL